MTNTPSTPLSLTTMSPAQTTDQADGDSHVGPHRSYIQIARQFMSENRIRELLKASNVSEQKEDTMRLQGVAWIDNVRKALNLPVRTFATASIYYHRFRLGHSDSDYRYIDAVAAAALFTACKIEDTQKRSRDILCAAHNLKVANASEQLTQDDARFETQAKSVIALERDMLESSAFDFRSTWPQKLVVKLARAYACPVDTVGKTAWDLSLDLYRTFAPLKQTSQTLALACVELAARLHEESVVDDALLDGRDYPAWRTTREEVMETMQDLLELYIQHGSKGGTIVGQSRTVEAFIAVRISLNQEATEKSLPRYCLPEGRGGPKASTTTPSSSSSANGTTTTTTAGKANAAAAAAAAGTGGAGTAANGRSGGGGGGPPSSKPSPTSPADSLKTPGANDSPPQGTVRFMLDGEMAQEEKATVDAFFKIEHEEVEIEEEVEASKLRAEREREEREERAAERAAARNTRGHPHPHPPDRDSRGSHRPWDRGGHHQHDRPPRDMRGRGGGGGRGMGRGGGGDRGDREDRFIRDSRYDRDHDDRDRDRDSDRFGGRESRYDRDHDRDRRRL